MATVALAGETFAPTVTGGGIVLVDPSPATAIVRYRTSLTARPFGPERWWVAPRGPGWRRAQVRC